jgi:uncharacterized damage-inducible protein DinB
MNPEQRPASTDYAPYYGRYVDRVPDGSIVETLRHQLADTLALVAGLPEPKARHRYAPGKWSVKEVLGHVADCERVFAYRALRIGRGDTTPLAGFDQDAYAAVAPYDERPLASIVAELQAVRAATLALLEGFDEAAWGRRGTANDVPVSVRAIAWIIAGHERHHREVLRGHYL